MCFIAMKKEAPKAVKENKYPSCRARPIDYTTVSWERERKKEESKKKKKGFGGGPTSLN